MKYVLGLVLVVFGVFYVVVNYSVTSTTYTCRGDAGNDGDLSQTSVHFRLGEARWWVGLWSDSYGDMNVELPSQSFRYFSDIREAGELLLIYDFGGEQIATYSRVSKSLKLKLDGDIFEGSCEQHQTYT